MAQIVTITNPLTGQPAQVDQLEHTAQQIDDAIGRALPGGEIDTLLAGKAPAGYGLGETLPTADANEYSGTGFFNSVVNSPTAPQRWTILQIHLVLGNVVRKDQLAFRAGSTFTEIAVRKYTNEDGFTPWEWLNPPMKPGVEYRTTERRNGLPVYTQFKNLGKIVNGAYGDISVTNLDSVVGYEAFWVNRPLPIIKNSSLTDAETQYLNVYVLNANTIRVYYYGGTSVSGNGDVYVLVKYTKST